MADSFSPEYSISPQITPSEVLPSQSQSPLPQSTPEAVLNQQPLITDSLESKERLSESMFKVTID